MSAIVLDFVPCRTYGEFVDFDRTLQFRSQNLAFEYEVSRPYEASKSAFTYEGFCAVCGRKTIYSVDWQYAFGGFEGEEARPHLLPCWKERIACTSCGENSRYRALIQMMLSQLNRNSVVHLAEYGSGTFRQISKHFPLLLGSEFFADGTKPGEYNANFVRFEDLTRLSFPDDCLDACVNSEVMEHIPDYKAAISEMHRVLKHGGKALLTTPFRLDKEHTSIRATVNDDGTISHILSPEYHGSRFGEVLCFQHFGWDLVDEFRGRGFGDAAAYLFWNPSRGHLGVWDLGVDAVIMATKSTSSPSAGSGPPS